MVALSKESQVLSGANPNGHVNGDCTNGGEECVQCCILLRTGPMPQLCDGHG